MKPDEQKPALSLSATSWELLNVEAAVQQDWISCERAVTAYGLSLTKNNVFYLHVRRGEALAATGRVELGRGIVRELVEAFATSVYVKPDDFEDTVADVQDLFYQLKEEAECCGGITDDDLVSALRWAFDEVACGSIALLEGMGLCSMRAWGESRRAGAFDQSSQFDLDESHEITGTHEINDVAGGDRDELDRIFDKQRIKQMRSEGAVGIVFGEGEASHLGRGFVEDEARIGGSRLA